jgi:hypothetical protein
LPCLDSCRHHGLRVSMSRFMHTWLDPAGLAVVALAASIVAL